jgi:transposase-like protein
MGRKRHTAEQIIGKLRTAEIELAKGLGTAEVVRKLGIAEQTYYRWRKEYGGLRLDQAKRLKEFEKENTRLKKLVADNSAGNCSGSISSLGHNLTDDGTCAFTEPTDLIVADAMLGPLQDNGGSTETHDLLPGSVSIPGSPAIDAGDNVNCPATDQRGVARPQGAACDIGAVEYLPEPHHAATLVAGTAFLGPLYRRRARGLRLR